MNDHDNNFEDRLRTTLRSERTTVTARMRNGVAGSPGGVAGSPGGVAGSPAATGTGGMAPKFGWARVLTPVLAASLILVAIVGFNANRNGNEGSERIVATQPENPADDGNGGSADGSDPTVDSTATPPAATATSETAPEPTALPVVLAATQVPALPPTPPPAATPTPEPTVEEGAPAPATVTATPDPEVTPDPTATPAPTSTTNAEPTPTPAPTAAPTSTTSPEPTATPAPTAAATPPVSRSLDFAWVATARNGSTTVPAFDAPGGAPFTPAYTYPDGTAVAYELYTTTFFGNALTLQVVSGTPDDQWVEVLLPVRPLGTTAWVQSAFFDFTSTDVRVSVSLSSRTLQVTRAGAIVFTAPVTVGSPNRPTPLMAIGYIDEVINIGDVPRGPWVFSMSLFTDDPPGPSLPKVAIQGTQGTVEEFGDTAGSVTVTQSDLLELANLIGPGTIAEIVP